MLLSFFIVYGANWTLGDDVFFLTHTAIGNPIMIDNIDELALLGRFFPLASIDYNLTLLFSGSVESHYYLNAVGFVLFSVCIWLLLKSAFNDKKSRGIDYIILFTVLFLMIRVYPVFINVIFPERITSVLLSIFLYTSYKFMNTEKLVYCIISLSCAAYLVYCKEPLFGSLLVFSTLFLFNWKFLSLRKKIYLIVLIINSIVFIFLYYILFFRHINGFSYICNHGENDSLSIIFRMVNSNKIIVGVVIIAFVRIIALIRNQFLNDSSIFFDAMLFSGIAYFVACLILQLNYVYYYIPAIILVTPAFVYWIIYYVKIKISFLIMCLLSIFYLSKTSNNIQSAINRDAVYNQVLNVANIISQGNSVCWFTIQPTIESYDFIVRDWKRTCLRSYLVFLLKNESFDFRYTSSFDKGTYILYAEENDKIKKIPESLSYKEIDCFNGIHLMYIQ